MDVPGADKVKARLEQLSQQGSNSPEAQKQAAEQQKMMAENLQLKNENGVIMRLESRTQGLQLNAGSASGIKVTME